MLEVAVDLNAKTVPLRKVWQTCVGAGRANEGLRADWQKHLAMLQKDCGFRYLRFHGLLHDDMHVYRVENGIETLNFQYVDALFDSLLAEGIRPFVEFGFMPKELASTSHTVFWWKGNASPPSDYAAWARLVEACVRHWVERYGLAEVSRWYFEIWNEANLASFWDGTRSQYFELYRVSALAVKRVSPALRVGGPATSNFVPDARFAGETENRGAIIPSLDDIDRFECRGVWIEEFLDFCARESLPVDFVSTHPYPTDFALDEYGVTHGTSRGKDALADDLRWLRRAVRASAFPNAEIHCTEWSSSPSPRDCAHDFLPEAAYILRSSLLASGLCDSLSYWVFTDVFEESGAGPAAFHGGFGLITLQGVKKPSYHAYRMLCALGEEEAARGDGYIVTKGKKGVTALFWNYPAGFEKSVTMSIYPDDGEARRVQALQSDLPLSATLTGLAPGCRCRLEILDRGAVSSDLWIEMGRPGSPSPEQTRALAERGENLRVSELCADDAGVLRLSLTLEAWSAALLTSVPASNEF
jgi:xylan 1,4-beta-xylosidase